MTNKNRGCVVTQDEQQQADESLNINAATRERGDMEEVRRQREFRARLLEDTVQPLVERVARASRQIRAGHPHRPLPRTGAASAHRHLN